jgi:hypothetical protein
MQLKLKSVTGTCVAIGFKAEIVTRDNIFSHLDVVTTDGVWFDNRLYRTYSISIYFTIPGYTYTPVSKVTSLLPLLRSGFRLPTADVPFLPVLEPSPIPQLQQLQNALCFTHFTRATLAPDSRLTQAGSGSSYFATDGQSASLSWRWTPDQIFITVGHLQSSYCRAPSLTRGWVCNLLVKFTITIWSKSRTTHDHILLTHL